jgi:hypothetical protein
VVKDKTLIEKLAALEHDQWIAWAQTVASTEPNLSEGRVQRWEKYFVPYSDLDEETKEHDRVWARKVIEVINNS